MKHRPLLASVLGVVAPASCSEGGEDSESLSRVDQALLNLGSSNFEIDLVPDPEDSTSTNLDDLSETYYDLLPGTYTCTVVIDP